MSSISPVLREAASSLPPPLPPALPAPAELLDLGRWLQSRAYRFITVTPLTHQRILARHRAVQDADERDAFGWSRPFAPTLLPHALGQRLLQAGIVVENGAGGAWRSTVRWSTLGGLLISHSAYPTTAADAVFFGPDTYRFASLITETLRLAPLPRAAHILDMGCGGGPGGLLAAYDFSPGRSFADSNRLDTWFETFTSRYPFRSQARPLSRV